MQLTRNNIKELDKIKRLNIVNSIIGIKPGNLIGTQNSKGNTNLAIFSSVLHLGSNPALLGFILRPFTEVPRHTYQNILETGIYTINHIHTSFVQQAHFTSAKFEKSLSEFDVCGLHTQYISHFDAPFVKESKIKMGMKYLETIPIPRNNTNIVIGQIEHILINKDIVSKEGYVNLDEAGSTGIGGLNSYYKLDKITTFPYARKEEVPNFDQRPK